MNAPHLHARLLASAVLSALGWCLWLGVERTLPAQRCIHRITMRTTPRLFSDGSS